MVFPVKPRSLKRSQNEESTANSEGGKLTTQITLLEDFINVSGVKKKRHFNFSVHPKRKIALQFLYYGWQFDGLVQQNNTENTVEKYLMDALLKTKLIEDTKCCDFSRCGRTDKGVSALKQVAAVVVRSANMSGNFVFWPEGTDQSLIDSYPQKDELSYVKMLNAVLPDSISVTAWAPVPRDFSARHACNMRIYKYTIPRANLDLTAMQRACQLLVGRHDFRNFCQVDMNESRVNMSYVRDIFEATIELIGRGNSSLNPIYELLELTVKGSGFLWHMIRFIVTVLHEIGQGNEKPDTLLDVTSTPSRPHYALAVETPLCLFDCRFDSYDMEWTYDDYAMKKTIGSLQSTLAGMLTKSRILENMLTEVTNTPGGSLFDLDKGLLEFTQDRTLPVRYVPFADRKTCDTLEEKRLKLEARKASSVKNLANS